MKQIWKKCLVIVLSLTLFWGQGLTAFALWNGASIRGGGGGYLGHANVIPIAGDIFHVFQLQEGESSVLPLKSFTGTRNNIAYTYIPEYDEEQADFSRPIPYKIVSANGKRIGRGWLLARPFGSTENWSEEEKQDWVGMTPRLIAVRNRLITLLSALTETVEGKKAEIGGYHPAYERMVEYLRDYDFLINFGINEMAAYGENAHIYTEEEVREVLQRAVSKQNDKLLKADQMEAMLECIEQWCDEIEEDRIASPDIQTYQLGDYKGMVDGNAHVTLTIPETAVLPKPEEAVIGTTGTVKYNMFAGSVESGTLMYRLTPYAAWTGTVYDGKDSYSFQTDLGKTWIVEIRHGDPILKVTSLKVKLGDRAYRGVIDEENRRITLTLPEGTDLTSLAVEVEHTAAKAAIGGHDIGEPTDLGTEQAIVLTTGEYTKTYQLVTELGPSAECDILSYEIDGVRGKIEGNSISLTLPWGTDLTSLEPQITISEEARITERPEKLSFSVPMKYVVTAQSGMEKIYTVTLTEQPVSGENQITGFYYGSIAGTIDQNRGTIRLEVPMGTDLKKLTPKVQVSEFAQVYPASGEEVDFSGSQPVEYTVTAQNGSTNTYEVTVVTVDVGENPHTDSMISLRNNIIKRYETQASDDWEWMNVGFFKHEKLAKEPGSLPAGLEAYVRKALSKLDVVSNVAMTNLDRTIMMLTACGIDASNLDAYTTKDDPFVDSNGEPICDLTAVLYNYSGSYTINGPIFALIALDMGNYTIPQNAIWTRDTLLETILTHKYGTDNFGVDMVGMLMQSIAPYQNDEDYGERVRAKLEEGVDLFLGNQKAPSVDAMQPDFTFGGFGYQSSESAAQVICALSAFGIDCHTDARFSDGKGKSVLTAFLDYADGEYFAHTPSTPKNALATYEGCYTVQWYLGFLKNGGAGHPYSLYYHQQDFSRPLSTEAEIKSLVLEGKEGEIIGDQITVTLPKGTVLSKMTPEVTLSEYATLDAPSFPVTFAENVPQPFTVRAEDGVTTKTYYVTVKLEDGILASGTSLDMESIQLQDAKILRDLEITGRKVTENGVTTDILLSVPAGVDTENLYIKGTLSYGAVSDPVGILDGKTKVNLSGWQTIRVTSEDTKKTTVYRIKVEAQETASIESFSVTIDDIVYRGVIDNEAETIQVRGVPSDADVTALAPEIELGEGTNVCSPLSGIAQNFTSTVNYTVSGNGLATRVYAVDIFDADGKRPTGKTDTPDTPSNPDTPVVSSAKISEFSILGVDAVIDHAAGTILLTLPAGTEVSHVVSQVTVGNGCTVSPAPGEVVDLRNPVVYTVTNGTETSYYTVIVTLEKSQSQQLWEKMEEENTVTDHQVVRD